MKRDISKALFTILDKDRALVFQKLGAIGTGVLSGGTAIAVQLLHRRSFDFDIFLPKPLSGSLRKRVEFVFSKKIERIPTSTTEFLDVILSPNIHLHFAYYPYPALHSLVFTESIPLFSIEDLASNKAYTLGRRATWRDYVDLFFILRHGLSLDTVINEAKTRFGGGFDGKLFLEQLVYFEDIKDFSVSYIEKSYKPEEILNYFQDITRDYSKKTIFR